MNTQAKHRGKLLTRLESLKSMYFASPDAPKTGKDWYEQRKEILNPRGKQQLKRMSLLSEKVKCSFGCQLIRELQQKGNNLHVITVLRWLRKARRITWNLSESSCWQWPWKKRSISGHKNIKNRLRRTGRGYFFLVK